MLRLKVTGGNATGLEIKVEDEFLIGRSASGPGALAQDVEISRQHARISRTPDGSYSIEDLGSTNGTQVNGRQISSPQILYVGDKVAVGGSTLVVQVTSSSATSDTAEGGPAAAQAPAPEPPVAEAAGAAPGAQPPPTEAQPPEAPEAPSALPRLALKLDVDFEAGEASLELDGESQPVRLVNDGGRWRVEPGP